MAENKKTDLIFFESRLSYVFSTIGVFTIIRKKLLDGETSPLHIGCKAYRNLITNLADQYCRIKPLVPHLMEIGDGYPERFIKIRKELTTLKKILSGFEELGKSKEIDLFLFLKGDGKNTEHDDKASLLLKNRLLQSINRLEAATKKEFNWLQFNYTVEANMTTTERDCYTPEGLPSRTIKAPSSRKEKAKTYLKRKPFE